MSDNIISYTAEIESDCEVTKMSTFTSKGGGLTIQIQLPLEGKTASLIADHLNNVARVRLQFSSAKITHTALEDDDQPNLDGLDEDNG